MKAITGIGKYLYALPIFIFGLFHFMNANAMAGMVPLPGGVVWVYITGAGLLAAALSIFIGKYDKLGTFLLGIMLLIFAFSLHLPGAMEGDQSSTSSFLKDFAMAGAALMYAHALAKDNSVLG
jgi:uncharacterized membrane protein YphA (DoxX/SURF4 family)